MTAPRKLVVLLGAGASAEAGIPMTRELVPRIREAISANDDTGLALRAFNLALGGIGMHRAMRNLDPLEPIDIEDVVSPDSPRVMSGVASAGA